MDLDRAKAGEHTAAHIASLAACLPGDSLIYKRRDKDAQWDLHAVLLASLINSINMLICGLSGKKGKRPDLVGPSWMVKDGRKLESMSMPAEELLEILSKPRG